MELSATPLLVWGVFMHLIADWLLQNDWMARTKSDFRSWGAATHAAIHFVLLVLVFPVSVAILLSLSHMAIDTRRPLTWWRRVFRQTTEGPVAIHVAFWGDQVAHITLIGLAALLVGLVVGTG